MRRRDALELLAAGALTALPSRRVEAALSHAGVRTSVGEPPAPHAMPGRDGRRSRRAAVALGANPRVQRRLRVALGVGRGLVTRHDGGFFVLHPNARASRFDAQGKLMFSVKLMAEASSGPAVTSAGSYAFLAFGELHLLDDRGRIRAKTQLGDGDLGARSILATRDGGVMLASTGSLFKVSAFGELVFRRPAPEPPLELLETAVGVVCVTNAGSVQRLDGAGRSSKLGDLGGGAAAVTCSHDGTELFVRSGNHRLVSFDLREHRLRASIEDATLELDGPVLLSRERLAQVFTSDGLLVRYRTDGSEAQRVPIDPGARKAPGLDDALLLADGRLLVARTAADVALITPNGEVSTLPGTACPDPIGLFAAGPSSVLLACRSGSMLLLT